MRYKTIILVALYILVQSNCFGQNIYPTDPLPLSDLKFQSIFGQRSTDSITMFCLLGTGFFRTPRSENSDNLISTWLTVHPKAVVLPVSTLIDSSMNIIYCLVIDNTDTLNVSLIRNGCFPGSTMQRPQTWEEMSNEDKKIYTDMENELKTKIPRPNIQVHMEKEPYDHYIEQVKNAEQFASENRLGIWE